MNLQMFKLVLEKAEEPETKLPTSAGSWKKQDQEMRCNQELEGIWGKGMASGVEA